MGSRSRARARAQASQPTARPSAAAHNRTTRANQASAQQDSPPPAPDGTIAEASTPGPLPRSVLTAAAVEALEAVGVLAASAWAGIATANGHSYEVASGVAITIIGVATAIGLGLIARAVRSGRRWSRTPAMLTQLFTGIVAFYLIQSGRPDFGVPAILLAIVGLIALLMPASIDVLTPGRMRKS